MFSLIAEHERSSRSTMGLLRLKRGVLEILHGRVPMDFPFDLYWNAFDVVERLIREGYLEETISASGSKGIRPTEKGVKERERLSLELVVEDL